MNKKNITVFAIAALVLLNVVIAVMIMANRVDNMYHSEKEAKELSAILSEGGIFIDASALPRSKPDMQVYSSKTSGEADSSFYGLFDGDVNVGNDFSLSYAADGYTEPYGDVFPVTDKSALDELEKTIFSFARLNRQQSSVVQISYRIASAEEYGGGQTKVTVYEYVGKIRSGNVITAVLSGGKIVFLSGTAMIVKPTEQYTAKLCDCFDVLLKEKKYFAVNGKGKMTIASVEYTYDMCFDVLGTSYLIPACTIEYTDGTQHLYDLVSGDLIRTY